MRVPDPAAFGRFVGEVFQQRRKAIRNPLGNLCGSRLADVLHGAGLTGEERAGQIDAAGYRALFAAALSPGSG